MPVAAPAAESPSFSDVGLDHPFADEIDWAATNAVTSGYPDGTFRGGAPVTRQAFAAFLARYWVSPDVPSSCSTAPFPDVPVDSPFCPQITWLKARGLATGYPDGTFRPAATISRQALAAVLYRFRGAPNGPDPACDAKPASDVPVGHPFCGEIAWLADVGLTTATPTTPFNPGATTTRQAAVTFLQRLDPGCAPKTERTGGCPRPAVPGDYDGDRRADPMWHTFADQDTDPQTWFLGSSPTPIATAPGTDDEIDGDFDGDGRWEPAHADAATGTWTTAGGRAVLAFPTDCPSVADDDTAYVAEVVPVSGDWDGDRTTDPGWYCHATGTWELEGRAPVTGGRPFDVGDPTLSHDIPAPADYDGDGTTDLAVYRPSDGSWWVHGSAGPTVTGMSIGVPVPADYDGDGDDEPGVFRLDDALFEVPGLGTLPAPAAPDESCHQTPAPADHDGDGTAELAVTTIDAYVIGGSPTITIPLPSQCPPGWPTVLGPAHTDLVRMVFVGRSCRLGGQLAFDALRCPRVAVPGDMDGDRRADLAWRDEPGTAWGIAGVAGRHPGPDPACQPEASSTACIKNMSVAGDWDGDGDWDHGAYVAATGTWEAEGVSISLPKPDCATTDPAYPVFEYPLPVPGQWDTDWATDPAWYCPSDGTWHFEDGSTLALGVPGPHSPAWLPDGEPSEGFWYDIPVPGFDPDGDGVDDPAVYRPTDGTLHTADGVAASGLGLGLPLVGRYQGSNRLVTIFQPSADSGMDPPPQPEPHRWRFSTGGPAPVEVPLDPARPYLLPALLDVDGDGTDELAGIARDQLDGSGTTEHYLVDGQAPVEFFDEWAYLPMTMPAPTIYRFIPAVFMLQTCRTTDACPASLWP